MRRRAFLTALLGILAAAGIVITTIPAAATAPLHEVFIDQGIALLPDVDCGTFTIHETLVSERVDVMTYFTDAGDPVTVLIHASFEGILTNESSGQTLRDHGSPTVMIDLLSGTSTHAGVAFHYALPHQGLLLATNGRFIISSTGEVVFQAGQFDVYETDLTPICSLLA